MNPEGGVMATKVSKPRKTTAKKRAPGKQKALKGGAKYGCPVCGLTVTVNETCGCVDFCDIICCGEQMKPVKG
jgi:rubrerythrin